MENIIASDLGGIASRLTGTKSAVACVERIQELLATSKNELLAYNLSNAVLKSTLYGQLAAMLSESEYANYEPPFTTNSQIQEAYYWRLLNTIATSLGFEKFSEEIVLQVNDTLSKLLESNNGLFLFEVTRLLFRFISKEKNTTLNLDEAELREIILIIVNTTLNIMEKPGGFNQLIENHRFAEKLKAQMSDIIDIEEFEMEDGEVVKLEIDVYSQWNSNPELRTGMFSPELLRSVAEECHKAWGLKYSEGYVLYPLPTWTPETAPIEFLLDPPGPAKVPRGWVDEDAGKKFITKTYFTKAINGQKVVQRIPDTSLADKLKEKGNYHRMWSETTVRRWFEEIYAKNNPIVMIVHAKGQIIGWAISHNDSPSDILNGRTLKENDTPIEEVTYIQTIGFGYEPRMYKRKWGNIKAKIFTNDKLMKMTEVLTQVTGGVAITRMHLKDNPLLNRVAGKTTGLSPILVWEQTSREMREDGVTASDVRPFTLQQRWALVTSAYGQVVSLADPERGYFIRDAGKNIVLGTPMENTDEVEDTLSLTTATAEDMDTINLNLES